MTLDTFISNYLGKTVGYPSGSFVGECLSLVKWYIKDCFGFDPPPSGSNSAYGYWSNFPNPLGQYFTKVANTPDGVPKRGDIIIWEPTASNSYGHIAIFLEGTASSFKSLDQNWNGRETHVQGHYYSNVVGWLTPIMPEKTYTQAEWQLERDERNKNWDLYQDEKADHEATKGELLEVRTSHNQFLQSLATKLVCLADEANIIGTIDRLLEVEDQLTKARKDYSQLEKEKFLLESDKNREIERLQDELSDMRKENISFQSKLATQFIEIEKLSNRIEELLGLPQEKTISPPFNGLSGLINSIKSVLRRILWLK